MRLALAAVLLLAPLAAGCARLVEPVEEPRAPEVVLSKELPVFVQVATCSASEAYVRALVEAFRGPRPGIVVDVAVTSPQVAVKMVAGGEAQLAIVTAVPGQQVQSDALAGSVPLEARVLATGGLVLIVHASREVPSLTQADVVALFTGHALDWGDLGVGVGTPDIVVQDASSTSRGLFDARLLEGRPVSSAAVVVPDDRSVADYVAKHPTAIGYAAASVVGDGVRTVPVEVGLTSRTGSGRTESVASLEIVMVTPVTMTAEIADLAAFAEGARGREILAAHFD